MCIEHKDELLWQLFTVSGMNLSYLKKLDEFCMQIICDVIDEAEGEMYEQRARALITSIAKRMGRV
jgi:ABC-type transporter Mla MlaB component